MVPEPSGMGEKSNEGQIKARPTTFATPWNPFAFLRPESYRGRAQSGGNEFMNSKSQSFLLCDLLLNLNATSGQDVPLKIMGTEPVGTAGATKISNILIR